MDLASFLQILDSTVRLATPLLFACLAGLYSERAGVFDIGLEGKMLVAAMAAGSAASISGSPWVGLCKKKGSWPQRPNITTRRHAWSPRTPARN